MGIECASAHVCAWLQTPYGLVKRHVQFTTTLAARHSKRTWLGAMDSWMNVRHSFLVCWFPTKRLYNWVSWSITSHNSPTGAWMGRSV